MELGTAFAVVGFADQCIKYGGKLVRKCRDYKHAEDEAKEFLTAIEWNWMKTAAQLNFLKRIAESLDPEYLAMQGLILAELDGKLKKATLTLNQLSTGQQWVDKHDETTIAARLASFENLSPGKKTLYAIRKTSLKSIVDDLEKWQGRYDLTWMLIMRMESPSISRELKKESEKAQSNRNPFIISAKEMRDAARESIGTSNSTAQSVWLDHSSFDITYPFPQLPYPTAFIAAEVQDSGRKIMLDTMHCHPMADVPRTTREVCNLACVLSKVDPRTFGLLKCLGIMKGSETVPHELTGCRTLPTFTFVFDVSPELSNPRSLRTVLQQAAIYSLNEKFELAKQITHSILYVHTARFVHKNIRPETIVVFTNSKSDIGAPFLLGFEKVRHEDGQTYGGGDGVWEKNLYRYPTRQGLLSEEAYKMQHDIYSVGIILLEIGLWTSFLGYEAPQNGEHPVAVPNLDAIRMSMADGVKSSAKQAFEYKHIFEDLAENQLPIMMGQKYTDVVLSCLRCLDGTENDTGAAVADYLDENGVVVGVRFVESILSKIHEISL